MGRLADGERVMGLRQAMTAAVRAALFTVVVVASLLAPPAVGRATADPLKPAASNAVLQPIVAANPSNDFAAKI